MSGLTIRNLTRQAVPGLLFTKVAKSILPKWEISLVFIGETRAKRLNKDLRGKTYTPNVLSYALSKTHGEIFICPKSAARGAHDFGLSTRNFMLLLFIHGLLHLKGYRHGTTMEEHEQKVLKQITRT